MIALAERQGSPDWWAMLAILIIVAIVWIVRMIRTYHSAEVSSERLDRRIPERERQLLGDSAFDCVSDFFAKADRKAEIIREVTGAERAGRRSD